jgi:hypothetical protein
MKIWIIGIEIIWGDSKFLTKDLIVEEDTEAAYKRVQEIIQNNNEKYSGKAEFKLTGLNELITIDGRDIIYKVR